MKVRPTADSRAPVPDVGRIAVLRANALGDFLVALPALEALRAAYPQARITVLGDRWHPALTAGRPGPWDEVVVLPAVAGVRGSATVTDPVERDAFLAASRVVGYDVAVQLHGGGGNSNAFVAALGARVTAGCQDVGAPTLDRTLAYRYYQHEVLRLLEVVGLLGAPPVCLEPSLAVLGSDVTSSGQVLADPGRPLVAMHCGATDERRRWPLSSFAAVADELAGDGCLVVLVGGEDDAHLARQVVRLARSAPVDLAGRLALPATTGLLSRCALLVGNDSGPRHLAAAVGTPTAGVFWVGNVINTAPLTRARHRIAVSFRVTCPVCGVDQTTGRCPHDVSFVAEVPVAEVLGNCRDLLAGA